MWSEPRIAGNTRASCPNWESWGVLSHGASVRYVKAGEKEIRVN